MRTTPQEMQEEALDSLRQAFEGAGLGSRLRWDQGADLVLDAPGGPIYIEVKAMALADRGRVMDLLEREQGQTVGPAKDRTVRLLVADQLPKDAQALLQGAGWGYLDRRGALWLQTDDVVINDTTIGDLTRDTGTSRKAIRGRVGLSVALHLLMNPEGTASVRGIAEPAGAAPSTVHEALNRLREHALIDGSDRPLVPELFRAVAAEWRPERLPIAREPSPADSDLGLNLDEDGPGWVVGGDVGAAASGARIVVGSSSPPDFYVPSPALVRRAVRRLGTVSYEERGATVAVAPSPIVTATNWYVGSHQTPWLHWPIAHPVVIALDLAQDASRGQEILDEWTPQGFARVW